MLCTGDERSVLLSLCYVSLLKMILLNAGSNINVFLYLCSYQPEQCC